MVALRLAALVFLAAGPSVAAAQTGSGDLPWTWTPEPRWLGGAGFGIQSFEGGLEFGADFLGSTVPSADAPPIRIVFDPAVETRARVYDRQQGYASSGVGVFRGAAYDLSDPDAPRRLAVALAEDPDLQPANAEWDPDGSPFGSREYLLVLADDYDPDRIVYGDALAYDLPTYYGLAGRLLDGHTLYETVATFEATPAALRDVTATAVADGEVDVTWTAATYAGGTEVQIEADGNVVGSALPADRALRVTGLDPSRTVDLVLRLLTPDGVAETQTVSVRPSISYGVAAYANLDPGRAVGSTYGDTWGYVAPDGAEYALLAVRGAGLSVIDVSAAPAGAPVEVAFVPAPAGSSDAKDVKVSGRFAYVVNEYGPIQIVDLADPTAPAVVGLLDVQPGVTDGGAHNVAVFEDHLWVTGGRTSANAGVRAYSLADPAAPALVGAFEPTHQPVAYYHDFEVRDGIGYGSAIYSGGGVDVLDVSDPSDIRLLSTFTYPGAGAHNTCTTEDGGTVYVGDEVGTSGNWIRIFDTRDLDDVELVGEIVVDSEAVVHNCYVRGDRLYVAHYTEGLRVYDVSDPLAPVEVAFLDTYPEPGYGFRGAWTAYPYLPSGKVIVSDLQSGLWVVALEGTAVAVDEGVADGAGLRVWPNPVTGRATLAYDLLAPAEIAVSVVDVLGREVARPTASGQAGAHRVPLDVAGLPAGVYLARLSVDGRVRGAVAFTVAR